LSDSKTRPELACPHCGGRLEASTKVYFDLTAAERCSDGTLEVTGLEFSRLNDSLHGHPVAMESELVVSCAGCGWRPGFRLAGAARMGTTSAGSAPVERRGGEAAVHLALSPVAYRTVCGLVQPNDVIDSEHVLAPEEVWAELLSTFPVCNAAEGEVEEDEEETPSSLFTVIGTYADAEEGGEPQRFGEAVVATSAAAEEAMRAEHPTLVVADVLRGGLEVLR